MLPANWPAVRAFCAASTQWKTCPWTGRRLGLDYAGAKAAAEGEGLEWSAVLDGVRAMEAAVLAASAG